LGLDEVGEDRVDAGSGYDFLQWWSSLPCPRASRRDLWTAVIMIFWCIWRHRNDVVFNGARPGVGAIRCRIKEEFQGWRLARFFCSEIFGFPKPLPHSWRDGD
jgi:hypothetical protein